MPDESQAQHNYMEMIAHGGKPRGGGGPSPAVAEEFVTADKTNHSYKNTYHVGKKRRPTAAEQSKALS